MKLSGEDFEIVSLLREENCYEALYIDEKTFVFAELEGSVNGTNR